MKKILALDIGIRNLAYCYTEDGVPVQWENVSIVDGPYVPTDNVSYIHHFVAAHRGLFEQADTIVIERQMRVNMRIIEAVLHALYFKKTKLIHARSVKQRFGLCRRNYRQNKQAAVEYVQMRLHMCQPEWSQWFRQQKKKDDLADSYLMALFFSSDTEPEEDEPRVDAAESDDAPEGPVPDARHAGVD